MISNVTTSTDPTAAAATMKKTFGMDKDDFMKLFITQLQYQDPLKPQDPSAMLDQLSQLSLVEQSYNSTTAMNKLLTAQNNSMSMTSVSFIGKEVKANGNSTSFDGSTPSSLQFNLSVPTAEATLTIKNASGSIVKTVALGAKSAGDSTVAWDGSDNSGNKLPSGVYSFSVAGKTAGGESVAASTFTTGRIDGVNLTGDTPMLTIGANSVALTDVISVKGV